MKAVTAGSRGGPRKAVSAGIRGTELSLSVEVSKLQVAILAR